MAKFRGNIGYVQTVETSPGVWSDETVTRLYSGDVLQNNRRWQQNDKINEDLTISIKISIISDNYILENLMYLKLMAKLLVMMNCLKCVLMIMNLH